MAPSASAMACPCWPAKFYDVNERSVPSLCARTRSGDVQCSDNISRLGPRDDIMREIPAPFTVVDGVAGAVRLSGWGTGHACALLEQRRVACWGSNEHRELGVDTENTDDLLMPAFDALTLDLEDVRAIAVGRHFSCALTDHDVQCWGERDRVLGTDMPPYSEIEAIDDAQELASSGLSHCARHRSGRVSCWGYVLGGRNQVAFSPVVPVGGGATRLWAGAGQACVRRADGLSCWGEVVTSEGRSTTMSPRLVTELPLNAELVPHSDGFCHRSEDGSLVCPAHGAPAALAARPVIGMFTRDGCASDGARVDCWRRDYDSTETRTLTMPAPVTQLAVGSRRACGLTGGRIACWDAGSEPHTMLSPGDRVGSFTQIASNEGGVCGITDDRRVRCWSSAPGGPLGEVEDPFGLADLVEISAADQSFCARRAQGTVVCWGRYALRGIRPYVAMTPVSAVRIRP